MNAEELDKKFDEGGSIIEHFDLNTARRPGLETECVSIDFPMWMIAALDKEAQRLGVQRQAIVTTWIAQLIETKVA